MTIDPLSGRCASCAHFRNDPAYLEATFGGLTSLSSAYGSVRAEDGLCLRRDRYVCAAAWCGDFRARDARGKLSENTAPPPG